MRPRGTAVRFELIDRADVEEPAAATPWAVIAWKRYMREVEHVAASTMRRRIAALSSLYKHPVRPRHAAKNPGTEVA
jgi:site-specific recombinase XerD